MKPARYPTPEEVQALMARARRLRAEYLSAMLLGATLRAKQHFVNARERSHSDRRHFYPDTA